MPNATCNTFFRSLSDLSKLYCSQMTPLPKTHSRKKNSLKIHNFKGSRKFGRRAAVINFFLACDYVYKAFCVLYEKEMIYVNRQAVDLKKTGA